MDNSTSFVATVAMSIITGILITTTMVLLIIHAVPSA